MDNRLLFAFLALSLTSLAGCAEGPTVVADDDSPSLEVSETTGGIRGVVVDDSITPVGGATITLAASGESTVTDEAGLFSFTNLDPGAYFFEATRPGYHATQGSAQVEAGVANPPVVRVQLIRIPGADPYIETLDFQGFYECAFALVFITDSCEFVYRTVIDELDGANANPAGLPRNVQQVENTVYYDFADSIQGIVLEGYWDESATTLFWFMVDSNPVRNSCDCSANTFVDVEGGGGYLRAHGNKADEGQLWPNQDTTEDGLVAVRGFVPFQPTITDAQYAVNVDFQIITSFFHHYEVPEGWTFETRYDYPEP